MTAVGRIAARAVVCSLILSVCSCAAEGGETEPYRTPMEPAANGGAEAHVVTGAAGSVDAPVRADGAGSAAGAGSVATEPSILPEQAGAQAQELARRRPPRGGSSAAGSGGRAGQPAAGSGGRAGQLAAAGSGGRAGQPAAAGSGGSGAAPAGSFQAGNPDGKCSQALPAEAKAKDSAHPTTVVGSGTAVSCTFDKLAAAIKQGGVITFACGADPVAIAVTRTLELPTDRDTLLDGAGKITLDGGGQQRILSWNSGDWQKNTHTLTLQHIRLANGKATPTQMIPTRPEPCSQGYNDGQGGALLMRDGSLRAIDVVFENNRAAELGPDTGGGALYLLGCKPAYIASCTFRGNAASNAGAMGSLFTTDFIYDSLFENNQAVGHGANNNDPSMCQSMNNGQNEIGSGGNGGAIYSDGVAMDITICGSQVRNNHAGAFGAGVFFTSNDQSNKGTLNVRDSLMFGNVQANQGWEWKPGISTNANTPEPINSTIRK